MNYILLLIGFVLLVKGADYFVDGSSNIAKKLRIPSLIIGLTIVAFGTSAPEAAVSITASINGQNGMAIGNVIGSNIFNLLMVIGASGIIKPLLVEKSILSREFPFTLLISIILIILSSDILLFNSSINTINRIDGIILLILFIVFLYYLINSAMKNRKESLYDTETSADLDMSNIKSIEKSNTMIKSILISVIGIAAIIFGGNLVVDSASNIASSFGVNDQLIGLTIVSIGTSLPEFVTSIIAATKGESDLALGNVLGSNIFNILFVIGASALISPMTVDPKLIINGAIMILSTILVYFYAYRKNDISKFESITLSLLYFGYMGYLIFIA
ncbi:K+-dependent Na+/Ca+ exchanger-like protein [Romboutsia ilealis]|uniref:K+-dependent Na+/Ca+ exchanger-like protein n=1 Tax=Romboutsia ilealis TaxID=1115758 RepID=A0A1V1HZS1_9FIRM|nr:calcium/sodium antiporter [Romboutsia ilealis]CED93379.1 K+-dependent Na+/Ca+ exchanger-like protein [Romboutsia ilealis]